MDSPSLCSDMYDMSSAMFNTSDEIFQGVILLELMLKNTQLSFRTTGLLYGLSRSKHYLQRSLRSLLTMHLTHFIIKRHLNKN